MSERDYFFANISIELVNGNPTADILEARERGYPIPLDPNLAVSKTLQAHGFVLYPSPIPTPDRYISARMHRFSRFPGFNYGTFVQNQAGEIAFAKLRYGPKNTEKAFVDGELADVQVGGLKREAQVLKTLAGYGYKIPTLLDYFSATPEDRDPEPDQADTLETLIIEAIPPEEGSTFPVEYWTPILASKAVSNIRTFAKPIAEISMFQGEERKLPFEILLQRSRLPGTSDYNQALKKVLDGYKYVDQPIMVHGDSWPTNIIVRYDESDLLFVDWELAGPGYIGQDAGRSLWGYISPSLDCNFIDMNNAGQAFIAEWSRTEDDKNTLQFGVLFESLRWIADREDSLQDPSLGENVRQPLLQEIALIKLQALKVLASI
jgi:hypothetical protein